MRGGLSAFGIDDDGCTTGVRRWTGVAPSAAARVHGRTMVHTYGGAPRVCTSSLLAATAFPASRGMQMAAVGPPLRGPERLCARVRLPSDFSGRCVRPPSQLACVWAMLSHRPTPPAAACLLSLAYIACSTPPRTPRPHASARQCSRGAAPDRHHHRPLLAHRAQLLLRLMHPKAPRGWLSCVVVGLGFSPRLHCAAGAV